MAFFEEQYPPGEDRDSACLAFLCFENWPHPNQSQNGTFSYSDDSPVAAPVFTDEASNPRNGWDWRPYTAWRTGGGEWWEILFPAALPVDYFAMAFYTTMPSFFLEYWNGAAWVRVVDLDSSDFDALRTFDVFEQPSLTIRRPLIVRFPQVAAARWRYGVETAFGEIRIGCMAFGREVGIPAQEVGFAPPRLARGNVMQTAVSEAGMFLGRSLLKRSSEVEITANGLPLAFLQDAFLSFLQHAERQPFFLLWSNHDASEPYDEAAFCWVEEELGRSAYVTGRHLDTTVRAKAVVD